MTQGARERLLPPPKACPRAKSPEEKADFRVTTGPLLRGRAPGCDSCSSRRLRSAAGRGAIGGLRRRRLPPL
ncbi:MAG: hypothetical protein MZV64_63375 [Ignavibacteriales bacterium]|nr:hypothetical protein [Ignavibacteriales bacterium]